MTAEKQVLQAVERAQAILARYLEPGERDCERTINDLLDVLDRDCRRTRSARRGGRRTAAPSRSQSAFVELSSDEFRRARPAVDAAGETDPGMDGSDLRLEGYRIATREHAGEHPDTMPQVI